MTMEELNVIISAQTKPFRDELAKMQMQMKSATATVERQTGRIKTALGSMAKFVASLAIARALFNIGKSAINMASSLQEVQNVVDTAFGSMSWKAEQFAKNSITQFGMSELSAKKTASTYMAMASGMGLGADKASDMAITMAGLTGDVASFFNISQELADTKLKSVFTGETETLKDLGIVMTQTNLQAFALSQGISENISDMDQAQLTTLRYNYVLEKLGLAQGDFAKTSGSWANQVRILQEQWKQLLGIIGNGLVAVLTPVINVLNIVIGKIITFANVISAVFSKLFGKKADTNKTAFDGVSSTVDSGAESLGGYSDALDKTGAQAKKTAKEIEGSLAGFDELNVIKSGSDTGDSGGAGAGSGGSGGYAIDPIDWGSSFTEPDTSGIDAAVEKVMGYFLKLKDFFKNYGPIILAIVGGIVAGLGTLWLMYNWSAIVGAITGPFAALTSGFSTLASCLSNLGLANTIAGFMGVSTAMAGVVAIIAVVAASVIYLYQTSEEFRNAVNLAITNVLEILNTLWQTVLAPLFSFIADVFNTILVPLAAFLATVVVANIEVVMSILLAFWNNVLAPIAKFLIDILAIALKGVIDIWEQWKPTIDKIFKALMGIWETVFKPITQWIKDKFIKIFEEWGKVIEELIPSVKEIFQGLINFFVGIFTLDMDKAWEGITKIFSGFTSFLNTVFTTDWSKSFGVIGGFLNGLLNSVSEIFGGVKNIFIGIIDFIAGVFTGDWGRAWDGVVSVFKGIFETIAGVVKAPINNVIGIINGAISGINGFGFDVPDWVPFFGGNSFRVNVPNIPYLATGGIVNKSTLAMIGEAGQEAVIPLRRNTQGIEMIANRLLENMPVSDVNGATYLIQLVLEDGTVLAKKIIKDIKEYEIMTGKPAF